jgi:hypothetical protein
MIELNKGDYVFATKYSDGMSEDAWGVGFFDKFKDGRYYVKDAAGDQIRAGGFRRCEKVKKSTGAYIFMEQDRLYLHNLWELVADLDPCP